MKQGYQSLTTLAAELQRRSDAKRDFVVNTKMMRLMNQDGLRLDLAEVDEFSMNHNAIRQVGSHYNIPAQFHDRMLDEHPGLLVNLLNGLFSEAPATRLVRTLDGTARAFLSDRYRMLDNEDLAEAVLPILAEAPEMKVVSSAITETRFYIKAVFPRIQTEVKRGDVVQSGIVISNSEVGHGALAVQPLVFRLVCENGMIAADGGSRSYHVGRKQGSLDDSFEVFRDETRIADDKALWMKVTDVVRAAVTDASRFEAIVDKMREATERRIEGSPIAAVEVTAKRLGYTEGQKESVLTHLLTGGDLTQYGLVNAITAASQGVDDYDTATQMERDGGRIIELAPKDWQEISMAEAA